MRHVLFALSRLHCNDGIASHLATLLPALGPLGWEPHLLVGSVEVLPGNEPTFARIRDAAASYAVEPALEVGGRLGPRAILRQAQLLRSACGASGSRLIHLHGRGLGPAAFACGLSGKTRFLNVAHLAPEPRQRPLLGRTALRLSGPLLGDRVIAISREMGPRLVGDWGIPAGRLRLVPHGTDLSRFRPPTPAEAADARRGLDLPAGAFVFSQLARLGPIKRPDTVVRAAARLAGEGRDVVGVLAGPCFDEDRRNLEALADELGVGGRVRVLGHRDAREVLWASDAKVLASEREGFGLAVIEAMACGVVPVRTPVEGAADQIVDGQTGLLFPVGDDAALAARLRRLMDDPADRRRMGEAAGRVAREKFSVDAMAEKTISVYRELLNGAAPDPSTVTSR